MVVVLVAIAHFPGYQDDQQHHHKDKNNLQHLFSPIIGL
jgi:hypothetical protein